MPKTSANFLPAGFLLTITAPVAATGSYRRRENSGAGDSYSPVAIGESSTTIVGPFTTDRNYEVVSNAGDLSYTITKADLGTTGTGDTVRAAAPTITAAVLSAPVETPPVAAATTDGAVTIAPGTVKITKAGVCAMTLAAPVAAQEGIEMVITSATANAHTLTATGLIQDGVTGGAKNLATFAAFVGATVTLKAIALTWNVVSLNAVVIS